MMNYELSCLLAGEKYARNESPLWPDVLDF